VDRHRQAGVVDDRGGGGAGGIDEVAGVVGERGIDADGVGLVALGDSVGRLVGADIGPAAAAVGDLPLVVHGRRYVVAVAADGGRGEEVAFLRRGVVDCHGQAGVVDDGVRLIAGGVNRHTAVIGEGGENADLVALVAFGDGVRR